MSKSKKLIVLFICASMLYPAPIALSAPQGGKVVGGQANINQSGNTTTINQTSDRAIVNWNSFDIGKNEAVRHNMPSSNSAGLHRVVGKGGPSQIEGLLQSNGNVYLVNPAGVVIHNGAKIDVNGFVATTRDITNDNFMKGNMVFDRPGLPDAAIINKGNITLKDNGLAALVAPTVRNDGIIAGKLGKVALGGSDAAWKLDMTGDDLIAFTLDEKSVNTLHAADGTPLASVQNNGKIKADGGVVVMTAAQLDGFVGSVVNNGEISASSAETKGGKIIFRGQGDKVDVQNNGKLAVSSKVADGGSVRMDSAAHTVNSGKIDASGHKKGGQVTVTGKNVALTSSAEINASGNTGGGTVLVGGNARGKGPERNAETTKIEKGAVINADAVDKGNGGQVVAWADEKTNFDGTITARGGENGGDGGLVETSAKILIIGDPTIVDTIARNGKSGNWLLDPVDFIVAQLNGNITGKALSNNLETGNVIILSENGSIDGQGDIFIKDSVSWNSSYMLSLEAMHDVIIMNDINLYGESAGLNIKPINGNFEILHAKVNFLGQHHNLIIKNIPYSIINTIQGLQNINQNLAGNYALGSDIDASETIQWNDGLGFEPIGKEATSSNDKILDFGGIFNGLGHVIKNLYINRPKTTAVGLFGCTNDNTTISNIGIKNANIKGLMYVGSLIGRNGSTLVSDTKGMNLVKSSYSTGAIEGEDVVGGLIGLNGGNVSSSYSTANVRTVSSGGGLVGRNIGNIDSSYASGDVSGSSGLGGLVGHHWGALLGSNFITISNSYATGDVSGKSSLGGFVGSIQFDNAIIKNSYSTGKVGGEDSGGFAGSSYGNCLVIDSHWNIESSGKSSGVGKVIAENLVGNGTINWSLNGLNTPQMLQKNSYNYWDFENIWEIEEGKSYPKLRGVSINQIPATPSEPVAPNPTEPDPLNPDPVIPDLVQPDQVTPTPSNPSPVPQPDSTMLNNSQATSHNSIMAPISTNTYTSNNVVVHIAQDNQSINKYTNGNNAEFDKFAREACEKIGDHFTNVLSEGGSGAALNDLVNAYIGVNNRFLIVTLLEEGTPAVATLIATNNWGELLKDIGTNLSLMQKVMNVIWGDILLKKSSECYKKALEISNCTGERTREELIEIGKNLRAATSLGFAGMVISQDIYDDMKDRSDYMKEHQILGTANNIVSLAGDTALGLIESFVDIGLGINKNVTHANNLITTGNQIGQLIDLAEIGEQLNDLAFVFNTIDGGVSMLNLITANQKREYDNLVAPKVKQYDKLIQWLERLPNFATIPFHN